jgi:1,4-alpha-glucan branching enzyme
VGIPMEGHWREILNSDSAFYGGNNGGNMGNKTSEAISCHGRKYSLNLFLPPHTTLVFELQCPSSKQNGDVKT